MCGNLQKSGRPPAGAPPLTVQQIPQQRRERFLVLSLLIGVLLLTFALAIGIFLQHEYPSLEDEESLFSNVAFFFLINLKIIAVMVLGLE